MNNSSPIVVTGGTGTVGHHVVDRLRDAERRVRVVSRHDRSGDTRTGLEWAVADLGRDEGIERALAGAKTVVHCATGYSRRADVRAARHLFSAARVAGIEHVVLRNGWYWENYASALDSGRAAGKFFGAAGDATVSGAARRDYAEAAAVVVTTDGHAGKVYELAGAPAVTYPEIAAAVGTVIGADVQYINQTVEEYRSTLESFGLPVEVAETLAGMDPAIARGALYSESTDLQDLIGRPSTSVAEALSQG